MKIDTWLLSHDLSEMAVYTKAAESVGFDGLWTAETSSNPFLPLTLAAEHSQHLELGTGIAVAFPRSPAILAYLAWDLARYSQGRFILGLGSQVRAHNERRLGVKWEKPVTKMRETILALRAFWDCWQNDVPLDFEGEFFKLNLMTPFFNPGPHNYPHIPVYISAINKQMLQLAGELCEGVHIHPVHTVRYLEEFALPHLETGLAKSGRSRHDITLASSLFVVPPDAPRQATSYEAYARQQLAFYMSTPAYRVVLELHGWGGVSQQLSRLARRGEWAEMPGLVTDEILDTFAVSGDWAELPDKVQQKYGDLLDRVSYYLPYVPGENDEGWRATIDGFSSVPRE